MDALYPERSAQRRVKAISECFVPFLDGGQHVLYTLMSGFRSTVHTKSFFLLLLFSLICFDSCTDVRTHQTLFLFLLNMASFFSETTNLLHCFTPHTFPRISQPSNAYNSLFLSAYLCHFFLVFLAHSLGCHSEICQETNESCGDTKS